MNEKKLDWHLFWATLIITIVLSGLGGVIIGCCISIKTELTMIKTVLILKGIMPEGLATTEN
jgi:hypothetical protein